LHFKAGAKKLVPIMADDRVKMECLVCGYKSVPQWLNDRAHCLKCDAVVKTRASMHQREAPAQELKERRSPGEASTHKQAASSAMESTSGTCDKSPDGVHHWKYGKCSYCQKPEGKLLDKGGGVTANPGAVNEGCAKGGKCMFKFAKCTKCGRAEGALHFRSMAARQPTPSRSLVHAAAPVEYGSSENKTVAAIFKQFDQNGDGVMSKAELKDVLLTLGSGIFKEAELDQILRVVDVNGDGFIDHQEFAEWIQSPGAGADILHRMKGTRARGPERFFYDKSSYTGAHRNGGPASVSKGDGTAHDQSWKRPSE